MLVGVCAVQGARIPQLQKDEGQAEPASLWAQAKVLLRNVGLAQSATHSQILMSHAVSSGCPHNCFNRGLCIQDKCVCSSGWSGEACDTPRPWCTENCRGHGDCDEETLTCKCLPGYAGDICDIVVTSCLNNCRGHGSCNTETRICECSEGFMGEDCGRVVMDACPFQCSGRGSCLQGRCICYEGFTGLGCEVASPICPADCSGHGKCVNSKCVCESGYGGVDCADVLLHDPLAPSTANANSCPNQCSGRGLCGRGGKCHCSAGWFGIDCSEYAYMCPNFCSGHGECAPDFKCACLAGFGGNTCEKLVSSACAGNCSGLGQCTFSGPLSFTSRTPACRCYQPNYWGGEKCNEILQAQYCPNNCTGHGFCINGVCQCSAGYHGVSCERSVFDCPQNCSGNGICAGGKCRCSRGWGGSDCSRQFTPCPMDCSGHGDCVEGQCVCHKAWLGDSCNITCPRNCSRRGVCDHGICHCNVGWRGLMCHQVDHCPNDCNDRGVCREGVCECRTGWSGEDCSQEGQGENSAPPQCEALRGCSGHGECDYDPDSRSEKCSCADGWVDVDCNRRILAAEVHLPTYPECNDPVGKACVDNWVELMCPVHNFTRPPHCFAYRKCEVVAVQTHRCPEPRPDPPIPPDLPETRLTREQCVTPQASTCVRTWVGRSCPEKPTPGCEGYVSCHEYAQQHCPTPQSAPADADCAIDEAQACLLEWVDAGCPLVGYEFSQQCKDFSLCSLSQLLKDPSHCAV